MAVRLAADIIISERGAGILNYLLDIANRGKSGLKIALSERTTEAVNDLEKGTFVLIHTH